MSSRCFPVLPIADIGRCARPGSCRCAQMWGPSILGPIESLEVLHRKGGRPDAAHPSRFHFPCATRCTVPTLTPCAAAITRTPGRPFPKILIGPARAVVHTRRDRVGEDRAGGG